MGNLEHIGIAVRNLENSISLFENIFDTSCYKTESVPSEKVTTAFFHTGGTKIELLESTELQSSINRFIEKRGEGIHHIAFSVDNIREVINRLKSKGFELVQSEPKVGADNKLVCFLNPSSTNGVLIELCQENFSSGDSVVSSS